MSNQPGTEVLKPGVGEEQSLKVVSGVVERANQAIVTTKEEFDLAMNEVDVLKDKKKQVIAYFEPEKSSAWKTHQLIATKEKEILTQITQAIVIYDAKADAWRTEQIRKENIAKAEAEALARKEAEKIAEQEAEILANAGMIDEAEEVIQEAIENPAPVPVAPPSQTTHVKANFQTRYRAEVFSVKLLLKAVYEGKVSSDVFKINQVFLDTQARAYKEKLTTYFPGVKPIAKTSSVQRRR